MSLYILSNGSIESEALAPELNRSNVILDEIAGDSFSSTSMSWIRMHAKEMKMEHQRAEEEMILERLQARRSTDIPRVDVGMVDGNFFRGVRCASLFTGILVLVAAMIWRAFR